MLYQVNYCRNANKWVGKTYDNIDDAIGNGIVTMLEYFEKKSNNTEAVFGNNIESFYENDDLIPSFCVAEVNPTEYKVSPIREFNLESYIKPRKQRLLFYDINPTVEELTSVIVSYAYKLRWNLRPQHIWVYNIVSLFPTAERTNEEETFKQVFPDLYTSLIMLAEVENVNIDYPNLDTIGGCTPYLTIGHLVHNLKIKTDITFSLMSLIWKLKTLAEEKTNDKFDALLLEQVDYMKLIYSKII